MSRRQQSILSRVPTHTQPHDVVLISMPFGILESPSIALGLLKGTLAPLGISVSALYFTLPFAEIIGTSIYQSIANGKIGSTNLLGEWIFAEALFDATTLDKEGYINTVLRGAGSSTHKRPAVLSEAEIAHILRLRERVNDFLDACVEQVLAQKPKIVGLTSVFQQQVASLAMARRLKAAAPDVFIMMGGANCEGAMGAEMVHQFPFIDAVVSGEGDIVFPKLVQRILQGKGFFDLQGVYTRKSLGLLSNTGRHSTAPSPRRMDDLPYPDFDDFFEQVQASQFHDELRISVPYETSRGCWWGEKNHCTFCGLNGSTMMYRSKSAQRALDELIYLTSRYPGHQVSVVDNILDMKYFKDFVPMLANLSLDTRLFYEVKANLKKEQVQLLHDAGIVTIQPGIESLSSKVLTLMRKGVKGLQNIQLLKWCSEIGIDPMWNMLWGFPGEPAEEYTKMAEMIPLLSHLPPPGAMIRIRLDRFSPNFDAAEEFGFTHVTPYPGYSYIYPFAPEHLANLAYFFTYEYRDPQEIQNYAMPVTEAIKQWQSNANKEHLLMVEKGTSLLIFDWRHVAKQRLTVLTGLQKDLYLFCDSIRSNRHLQDFVKEHATDEEIQQDPEALLQPLIEQGLMICDGASYLSLAIAQQPAANALQAENVLHKTSVEVI
jgi:ribosomal peptide maturation radical SAM protein 1